MNNPGALTTPSNVHGFTLLSRSEGYGWIKTIEALDVPGMGCLVKTSTLLKEHDKAITVSEALLFLPSCVINKNIYGKDISAKEHPIVQM